MAKKTWLDNPKVFGTLLILSGIYTFLAATWIGWTTWKLVKSLFGSTK